MKALKTVLVICIISVQHLFAQTSPEDIFNHNIIFKDAFTNANFEEANNELDWLLENDPELSENVFIKGVKVLEAIMKETSDNETLDSLQTKSLSLYQRRITQFGNSEKVKNLELTTSYKYWINRPEKYNDLLKLFTTNVREFPEMVSNPNLLAFMDVMRRAKATGIQLSDEKIISEYDAISSLVETRKSITDDSDIYMTKIDAIFTNRVVLDCDMLESRYGDSLSDDFEAVGSAKLYLKLALKSDCKDSESFDRALGYVIKYDPSLKIVLYKARRALSQKNLEEAESLFGKALAFEMDTETKSDIYINLAKIYTLKEEKQNARMFAYKAIKNNGSKEAHSLIGNLYMSSFSECADGKDIVKRRAIYIAAYDQFKLAGDTQNMEIAQARFPSSEEIHSNLYHVGQKIDVECWFNESVELKRR